MAAGFRPSAARQTSRGFSGEKGVKEARSCTHLGSLSLLGGAALAFKLNTDSIFGAVAQLGEHLLCKQGVTGSIPVRSTCYLEALQRIPLWGFFLSRKSVVSCVVSSRPLAGSLKFLVSAEWD